MPSVEVELHIPSPASECWAAVVDVENYALTMDSVQSVTIIEQTGPQTRSTAWSVRLKGAVLEWVEAERIDHRALRFDFHQLSGDLAHFTGHWAVRPADGDSGSSLVSLNVEFEIGIPLLAEMLNPVAAKALRENAQQMLAALGQRLATAD